MSAPDGFDKQATQQDTEVAGMVKRGVVEEPKTRGSADDGFVDLNSIPRRPALGDRS